MTADKNEYLTETSNTLCDLYADRNVRERCLDRIEYNLRMKRYEDDLAKYKEEIMLKDKALEENQKAREEDKKTIKEQSIALNEKDALVKKLMEEIAELKQQK